MGKFLRRRIIRSRQNSEWHCSKSHPEEKEVKGQKLSYPDTPEQDTLIIQPQDVETTCQSKQPTET
jgi:hypothetical protein